MIRPAAPQQSAALEGLIQALSRTVPLEAGRSSPMKKIRLPALVRAYGALKAGLALIGLCAICGAALIAWSYDFNALRQAAGEMFFPPSVEVTGPILEQLEAYFGIPYPYEKLDSISLPVNTGAMENPGLVTYGHQLLLSRVAEDTPGR